MTKIIHALKGLPASGKTTLAKRMVEEEDYKRVSKDDLRTMLDNGRYSRVSEEFILAVRDSIIRLAISQGYHIVVDDTNLNPRHIEQLHSLANELDTMLIITEMDTTLEECLIRDKERASPIGEKVILSMYNEYIRQNG